MAESARNKMGKWGCTSYIIGNMLGSGIFITPTAILNYTNSVGLSLVVWAVSALIAALGGYCYVELGTSIRKSGNDFAYMCYVKWNAIGFAFMAAACVLTFPLTLAIQAQAFSEYFIRGLNLQLDCEGSSQINTFIASKIIGFALIWLLLFLNFFSLKIFVSRFQIMASMAKLLSAAIVIVSGFYVLFIKGKTENLRDPFANSTWAVGSLTNAFFSGLFSYDGWDILNFGAEDVENPKSSMSFAIVVGISTVALLYISMNLSYFTVLSIPEIQGSIAVATTFAKEVLGTFHYFMPFLISIVLIGSLNSSLFAASRCMYAAAREGQLPAFLTCKNERHDSPRSSLFFHVLLAVAFSFIGDIDQLINYVSFGMWIQRCFTMCALLYIRLWHIPIHSDAIRTPLIFPIIFLFVCLSLVVATITENFGTSAVGLSMLAICIFVYVVFLWERSPLQRSDTYRRCSDLINHWCCVGIQVVFNGLIDLGGFDDEIEETRPLRGSEDNFRNGASTSSSLANNRPTPLATVIYEGGERESTLRSRSAGTSSPN